MVQWLKARLDSLEHPDLVPRTYVGQFPSLELRHQEIWRALLASTGTCIHVQILTHRCIHMHVIKNGILF